MSEVLVDRRDLTLEASTNLDVSSMDGIEADTIHNWAIESGLLEPMKPIVDRTVITLADDRVTYGRRLAYQVCDTVHHFLVTPQDYSNRADELGEFADGLTKTLAATASEDTDVSLKQGIKRDNSGFGKDVDVYTFPKLETEFTIRGTEESSHVLTFGEQDEVVVEDNRLRSADDQEAPEYKVKRVVTFYPDEEQAMLAWLKMAYLYDAGSTANGNLNEKAIPPELSELRKRVFHNGIIIEIDQEYIGNVRSWDGVRDFFRAMKFVPAVKAYVDSQRYPTPEGA